MEMHESDRVLRQYRFQKMISSKSQAIEDLHYIDLWGRMDEHWPTLHVEYINIWNNKKQRGVGNYIREDHDRRQGILGLEQLLRQMTMDSMTIYRPPVFGVPTESSTIMSLVHGAQYSYSPTPMVLETPLGSLFHQGGNLRNHMFLK
ncbi:hypothetical protein Golob_002512 [Gossypium lobatum]|uniref:Uncharacterized protein n=1 Tax=Gossypium lobatum TaxID=34289 RepID=A0A7J8N5P3_9ROSI|nr:hypothetical protein [Gossypium lobatum]